MAKRLAKQKANDIGRGTPVPSPGLMGDNLTSGLRLAMWCGPRNISTALMRAWGNRPDTFVVDEPLYAHYLLSLIHI